MPRASPHVGGVAGHPVDQLLVHEAGRQGGDVPAVRRDLLDQVAGQERPLGAGGDEDGCRDARKTGDFHTDNFDELGYPGGGLSDFRCNWPLAFLVVRGVDASLEGDGEGVEC